MRASVIRYLRDAAGSSATEFALVLPLFIALTVGLINLCILLFAMANLHSVTEAAARCAAIQPSVCSSTATVQTYAAGLYSGPSINPTFTLTDLRNTTPYCGYRVSATATYNLVTGIYNPSLSLSAQACFPA